MPFYCFHIDVGAGSGIVAERLRAVVRERPAWRERFRMAWHQIPESHSQLVGIVRESSFRVRRDILPHRNAFMPFVWGRFRSNGAGTRVTIKMFMNPLLALFMLVWLGVLGLDGLRWLGILGSSDRNVTGAIVLFGMFILSVFFLKRGFFDEARLVRRIISSALLDRDIQEEDYDRSI